MIGAIVRREFLEFSRDRRFMAVMLLMLALLLAAALDGWNRTVADREARLAAVATDREVWVEQGENNPHGAAHFARYAFRDAPVLAAFDPGVFDFAGAAVWMEAHTQNPATLRRAEDAAVQAPFPALSPAWVVQVVGTLVLATVLFSAVAGEREQGTLKGLAATGVSSGTLMAGKIAAAAALVLGLSVAAVLVAILPALVQASPLELPLGRLLALATVYALGLLAFGLLILWISARSATRSAAFNRAALAWLILVLLFPLLGGQLAVTLFPDIDEQQLKNDIQLRAQTPFWSGDARDDAVAAQEARVLAEFDADTFEDLGFDREALVLQAHERFANDVYDELYGGILDRHMRQDAVLRYLSVLSPVLALQRLSAGIAGTDLLAQASFTEQAEQHRRQIIEQLNRDMMIHAGDKGFAYTADRNLWEAIPDFSPIPPSLSEIASRYAIEVGALLGWVLIGARLAASGARSALAGGH